MKSPAAMELAAMHHTTWLKNFRQQHPDDVVRNRTTSDGGREMNILVPWDELDPAWQEKQVNIHEVYVIMIKQNPSATLEDAAAMVHQLWITENQWKKDDHPTLFVSYDRLPENEKEKDRNIVRTIRGIKIT
jgi:hypothetical protein